MSGLSQPNTSPRLQRRCPERPGWPRRLFAGSARAMPSTRSSNSSARQASAATRRPRAGSRGRSRGSASPGGVRGVGKLHRVVRLRLYTEAYNVPLRLQDEGERCRADRTPPLVGSRWGSGRSAGGPDAVRIESLAKALGVTKGSFYGYFEDRRPCSRRSSTPGSGGSSTTWSSGPGRGWRRRGRVRELFSIASSSAAG